MRKKWKRLLLVFGVLLDADAWRLKNYGCVFLFRPINAVDRWLGFGRHPASEPLWGLSK
ncbi:MAG: hypothetical protein L0Y72_10140 [Gemmataceae bacterium]|nr:hypothetical protein [Gemmataceae bacterium]